ncbi:MAG: mechanosensitive ion channel family protein [Acidobacteria bacterium]|nr:MAG: mechanosensitive ion channel family protein [Acidobacteriota bacterium]
MPRACLRRPAGPPARPARAAFLAVLVAFAASAPGLADQQPEPQPPAAAGAPIALPEGVDLSSPRATFATYFDAMAAWNRTRAAREKERALACFDLSEAPSLREELGWKAARNLKFFLDRVQVVDLDALPEQVDGDYYLYGRWDQGEISLTRSPEGLWRFSRRTVEDLDRLAASVVGRPVLEGIASTVPRTLADVIRARLAPSLLERSFLLENWQWFGLLLIALLGAVVERVVRALVLAWLRRLLDVSKAPLKGEAIDGFRRPLGLLAMAIVWSLTLGLLDLPFAAYKVLLVAVRVVLGASAVWALYKLVDVLAEYFASKAAKTQTRMDDLLVPLFRRALKVAVVAFGVLFVAQNLDVDVTSLLAGISIGGVAFALAAKDTVENLFGSVTVLIDRPFQIGDWVQIGDIDGTVVEVGLRSTRIRTFYNSLITVPNSTLVKATVDNLGAREYRRIKCMISVQYDTPAEKIEAFCEGIRELIRRHPYTRKDYYMVYLNQFAASSLDILLYCFVRTPDWPTELRERHRLFLDIVRLAHRLGIDFAFPTQTLHVATVPPGAAPAGPHVVETGTMRIPAPPDAEQAVQLGRREADALFSSAWKSPDQPPVDMNDPDRIPPV